MEEGRLLYPARQVPASGPTVATTTTTCSATTGGGGSVTEGSGHHGSTETTTTTTEADAAAAAAAHPTALHGAAVHVEGVAHAATAEAAVANMTQAEREVRLLPPHVRTFGTGLARHNTASVDALDDLVAVSPVQLTVAVNSSCADEDDDNDNDDNDDAVVKPFAPHAQRHAPRHRSGGHAGEEGSHTRTNTTTGQLADDDDEEGKTDDTMNARVGAVTEFDLAAYAKEEPTPWMQKRIMRRMFSAFDVTQSGLLDAAALREFCAYIGHSDCSSATLEKMYGDLHDMHLNGITFDKFWDWWVAHPDKDMTHKTFSLASADFSVPFHQQQLKIREVGEIFTPSYRVQYYFKDLETGYQRQVSPWHDVPLYVRDPVRTKPEKVPANRYNFICEIPKWTRAKFEIATGEPYNPIKQDIKNGIPRFYKHGDMMWNYGAFPQTWESTEVAVGVEGVYGDNDPLDGVEIGMRQLLLGEIHPVRVLGVLGMIDDGQMDWKVICMSVNDPIAHFIRDIEDVPRFLPGCLDAVREWFRVYKICQGGVENKFAFDGEFKNKAFAMKVLKESHYMWENLRKIKKKEKV